MTARKGAARAVCDVTEGVVLATVEIAAPPDRVFRALTDANEIVSWWGSDSTYRTTKHSLDLRVGGKWRSEGSDNSGQPFAVEGEFVEIDAPHKLVLTWNADWDGGKITTVTYQLEPAAGGTRLTLRHRGFEGRAEACRDHGEGWETILAWLAGFAGGVTALSAFMCRLIPPRPTFTGDMDEEERAVMTKHVAYWSERLAAGRAIVFGPVADPKGGWGLGVVRARDLQEVKAFEAEDPAILSGRGFRYEILPMLRAMF
ncbi:MAG: SRPBCC domain-containing protein [Myxococcota bacterium]|nr:SRPBCC domain-containing protein [Myxococcota bacterium]